jgi:gas vesicle protein
VTERPERDFQFHTSRKLVKAFIIFINQGDEKMEDNIEENTFDINGPRKFLIGLLIGGMAGALAMLLLAPQSGKRTRAQIQNKTIQLRDQTTKNIKKAVAQVRSETDKLTSKVQDKAGELKQLGQDKLVEQLDRVSAALDAGKTAVEAA